MRKQKLILTKLTTDFSRHFIKEMQRSTKCIKDAQLHDSSENANQTIFQHYYKPIKMTKNKKTRQVKRPYNALGNKMLQVLCSLADSYKVRMSATYSKSLNCHKSYAYPTRVLLLDHNSQETQCIVLLICKWRESFSGILLGTTK